MKTIFIANLTFVIAFTFISEIYAQFTTQLGFEFGVNFSNINEIKFSDGVSKTKTKPGIIAGVSFETTISPMFSFPLSARYVEKGFKYNDNYGYLGQNYEREVNFYYFELQQLVKLNILPYNKLNPYIFIGPYVGITTHEAKREYWGLNLGGGLSYETTKTIDLFTQVAYDYGISKVYDYGGKNVGIQLTIGTKFIIE